MAYKNSFESKSQLLHLRKKNMSGIVWLVCPLSEVKIILIKEYEKGSVISVSLSYHPPYTTILYTLYKMYIKRVFSSDMLLKD